MSTGDLIGMIVGCIGASIGLGAVLFVIFTLIRGTAKKVKK
jgi:hypothetical protein